MRISDIKVGTAYGGDLRGSGKFDKLNPSRLVVIDTESVYEGRAYGDGTFLGHNYEQRGVRVVFDFRKGVEVVIPARQIFCTWAEVLNQKAAKDAHKAAQAASAKVYSGYADDIEHITNDEVSINVYRARHGQLHVTMTSESLEKLHEILTA